MNAIALVERLLAIPNRLHQNLIIRFPLQVNSNLIFFKLSVFDRKLPTLFIFAPMKILMVCLGNICRSPLAEGILRHKAKKAGLNWTIESAGTNGYHVGESPHRLSQKVASLNGIDICQQKARKFSKDDFVKYDKIYAMAEDVIDEMKFIARNNFDEKKVDLLMSELYPGENIDVPDPWYGPEPGYHDVYKMIDAACDAIISKYENAKMRKFEN